jgi:hypothetical protein
VPEAARQLGRTDEVGEDNGFSARHGPRVPREKAQTFAARGVIEPDGFPP